jgi:hypothetical protein
VIHRCESDIRSNLLAEIHEHCIVEVLCIVDCDVSGDAVPADDVLPKEFFNCCGAYVGDRLHLYPLREIFNCHNGEDVIALHRG